VSRIDDVFRRTRAEGRAALVGYLTAYDPDRERSLSRICAACESGLDLLELGVPFSDPTADGPDIQAAMVRALRAGGTLAGALALASEVRHRFDVPIVMFGYANPFLRHGTPQFVEDAKRAGIDGLLVVDLPPEHDEGLRVPARASGLDWIGFCAPTTTDARLERTLVQGSGFVYAVSLKGVTGASLDIAHPELAGYLGRVRARTSLPLAVGFGVSTSAQATAVAKMADGVVVGSALVRAGMESSAALAKLVSDVRGALDRKRE